MVCAQLPCCHIPATPGGTSIISKYTPARANRSRRSRATVAGIPVTSLERVVYPQAGITKREILDYYEEIAPWLLPHLCDRPVTLVRCPDGIPGECFFQKHGGEGTPAIVPRVHVKEPDADEEPYVYIDGLPSGC
jgi:bifunctional non-homologous end joining protein LigD